jgi:hypothetical protein
MKVGKEGSQKHLGPLQGFFPRLPGVDFRSNLHLSCRKGKIIVFLSWRVVARKNNLLRGRDLFFIMRKNKIPMGSLSSSSKVSH